MIIVTRRQCAKCHQWYIAQGVGIIGACVSGKGEPSIHNPEHDWKEVDVQLSGLGARRRTGVDPLPMPYMAPERAPSTDEDVLSKLSDLGLHAGALGAASGLYRVKRLMGASVTDAYLHVLNRLLGKEEECEPVSWPEYITEAQKARARRIVAPQPAPKFTEGVAVWPLITDSLISAASMSVSLLVEADMIARDEYGRGKYKVPLMAGNGRDNLVDWYQEELDGLAYARAEIQKGDPTGIATKKFAAKLVDVLDIRAAIRNRDGE